jgi:hypothetical protein
MAPFVIPYKEAYGRLSAILWEEQRGRPLSYVLERDIHTSALRLASFLGTSIGRVLKERNGIHPSIHLIGFRGLDGLEHSCAGIGSRSICLLALTLQCLPPGGCHLSRAGPSGPAEYPLWALTSL